MYLIRVPGSVHCALYALQLVFLYSPPVRADEPELKSLWSKNSEPRAKVRARWITLEFTLLPGQ